MNPMRLNGFDHEIEKYMQASLDSTERSRRRIEESGALGVITTQELLVQREKFVSMKHNLDEVHETTQVTQRNLNSLTSVFGGIFKKKPNQLKPEGSAGGSTITPSHSSITIDGQKSLKESSCTALNGSRWEAMDDQIDDNLETMSADLHDLKRLAMGIGREVDSQNEMLDRINQKTEVNSVVIKDQVKQMENMIGMETAAGPMLSTSVKMSLLEKAITFFK